MSLLEEKTQRYTEGRNLVETEVETGVMHLLAQEHQRSPAITRNSKRGTVSSSGLPKP